MTGTWLVEAALRGDGSPEWRIVSGYGSEASARVEVRQLRHHYNKRGYMIRVRLDE